MTVRKAIENKAFGGRRILRRGSSPKIQVIAAGDAAGTKLGMVTFSSATTMCFIAIDTSGTGTKINA